MSYFVEAKKFIAENADLKSEYGDCIRVNDPNDWDWNEIRVTGFKLLRENLSGEFTSLIPKVNTWEDFRFLVKSHYMQMFEEFYGDVHTDCCNQIGLTEFDKKDNIKASDYIADHLYIGFTDEEWDEILLTLD